MSKQLHAFWCTDTIFESLLANTTTWQQVHFLTYLLFLRRTMSYPQLLKLNMVYPQFQIQKIIYPQLYMVYPQPSKPKHDIYSPFFSPTTRRHVVVGYVIQVM